MNIVRKIAACAAALLTVCGCVSPGGGRARWERAGDALLPELAFEGEDRAREFLARVARADDSLTEEDLLAALLVLMNERSDLLAYSSSSRELGRRLMEAILAHPGWSHRYDGFLKHYASTLPGAGEYPCRAVVREVFGLPAKRKRAEAVDYPLDGTWMDWLKPAAEKWDDRLTWRKLSLSSIAGVGWFKEPPAYQLPVKGRIHCLLRSKVSDWSSGVLKFRPRYSVVFKFDSHADLEAAVIAFNGGLDRRLYDAVPNVFYIPGAQIPPCFIMTYSDEESACYLMSVSSVWTWGNSTWKYLPDDVVPPSKQKGKR